MSKLSFWPSTRECIPARSTAEMWTNTSGCPLPCSMKPKPLVELKNFTVPVGIEISLQIGTDCHRLDGQTPLSLKLEGSLSDAAARDILPTRSQPSIPSKRVRYKASLLLDCPRGLAFGQEEPDARV